MADSLIVGDSLIVVPDGDSLVLATGDEVLSSLGYGKSIDLSSVGAVLSRTDGRSDRHFSTND